HIPHAPTSTLVPYTTLFRSKILHPGIIKMEQLQLLHLLNEGNIGYRITADGKVLHILMACKRAHVLNHIVAQLQCSKGHLFQLRSEEHTSELQSRFDIVCRL